MSSRARTARLGQAGLAAQVAGSQIALAASNYVVLALAARTLDAPGVAAVGSYYLLINTIGRGVFAAVELEATRAVALAVATGGSVRAARADALRNTAGLLAGALLLVVACTPLLSHVIGSSGAAIGLLAAGTASIAVSYLVRGPLAGERRYAPYAATFWLEAGTGISVALVLVANGVTSTPAWIAVFALAPLLAAAPLLHPATRRTAVVAASAAAPPEEPAARGTRGALLWSAALLLASQGVWNLAPVVVTARLTDDHAAAGFVAVAIILRAPVLVFPAVQALLLPAVTAMVNTGDDAAVRSTTRRLGALLAGGGLVWLVLAVVLVPALASAVFATQDTPPTWVLLVLAASTIIGAAAQIAQTHLVAVRRQRRVAVAWTAGLALLLTVALLVVPPLAGAALGQLAAAILVLVVLETARRRLTTNGARP